LRPSPWKCLRKTKKPQLIPEDKPLPRVLVGWEKGNSLSEYIQVVEKAPKRI
jgi:hypothetical protein